MEKEQAYLLGYWLGDGTSRQRRPSDARLAYIFGMERDWPRIEKCLNSLGMNSKRGKAANGAWEISLGREFANLVDSLGMSLLNGEKREGPWEWLALNSDFYPNILAGMFDADGCLYREKVSTKTAGETIVYRIYYTTIAKSLAYGFYQGLLHLGIESSLRSSLPKGRKEIFQTQRSP